MQDNVNRKHNVTLNRTPVARKKAWWGVRFQNWMVIEGPKKIFFVSWTLAQLGYFAYSFWNLQTKADLSDLRSMLGFALPFARGAANVINLNCAFILFTVCRNIISSLRSTFLNKLVPFEKNIVFHIVIAWSIVFWTYVHVVAHYFNYLFISGALDGFMSPEYMGFISGPGLTGQILSVALFLIATSAVEAVRRKYFEIFWFTHHLFIVFFGVLLVHGAFCFIKLNKDPKNPNKDLCNGGPSFWKWWVLSAAAYVLERVVRELRGRKPTVISKVVKHPSKVVEVQIKKPSCVTKAGQYVFLCCPEIAAYEWHPFTLTSSPHEEFISVHIRVVGDWTKKFAERVGCDFEGKSKTVSLDTLPMVMVDGPYGTASEDVFDYKVSVLVGAGIGVTPFASILKTIWYRLSQPKGLLLLKKVYFIWICREQSAFEWFSDLLVTLEEDILSKSKEPKFHDFLSINSYLTSKLSIDNAHNIFIQEADEENTVDAITGLKARTFYGRPNFDEIFQKLKLSHPSTDVGVFFCGPKALSSRIHTACDKWTDGDTRFFYGKENF